MTIHRVDLRSLRTVSQKLFLLFFWLFLSLITKSQLPIFGYEKVSTEIERIEKGLSQNSIRTMLQDNHGFIWFGTWSGLNRYDGQHFIILSSELQNPSSSLTSPVINALAEDKNGFLWVGTEEGLNRVDSRSLKVTNFKTSSPTSALNDTIFSLFTENQNLWIGTQKGLIVKSLISDSTQIIKLKLPKNIKSTQIRSIKSHSHQLMFLGTDHGLWIVDKHSLKITEIISSPAISSSLVLSLLKINDSLWLIGTENGLNILNFNSKKIVKIFSSAQKNSLPSSIITALMLAHDSSIWIATSGGGVVTIRNLHDEKFSFEKINALPVQSDKSIDEINDELYFYSLLQTKEGTIWLGSAWNGAYKLLKEINVFKSFQKTELNQGISDNHIWTFYEDGIDFWIGTERGVNIYNTKTHNIRHLTADGIVGKRLSSNKIRSIFKDSQGNFWIGTYNNALNKYNPRNQNIEFYAPNDPKHYIPGFTVWKIVEDTHKNLWIATHNGLQKMNLETGKTTVYRNNPLDSTSLSSNVVYNLYFDRQGSLWVATIDGLNLFLPDKNQFQVFKRKNGNPKTLNTNRIFCIYQDVNLNYWVGTIGGGLNKIDPITGDITHFTTNNGLADNTIYAILPDEYGNIWLPTNFGISVFNLKNLSFINYSVNDGLISNEFNFGAALKDHLGNMYFGGMFGFNVLTPREMQFRNLIPEIHVSEYKINDLIAGYVLKSGEKLTLNHNQNNLDLLLTLLDYSNPLKVVYKYRILNNDDHWRTLSANYPIISLSKLPPGQYQIEVIAMNSMGLWTQKPFVLTLSINNAWYNLFFVRLIAAIVLLFLASVIIQHRINRIRFKHRTERQLLELEKQTLQLQMNPHFIFNTLNSIQNFILKNDTDQSISYLSKFSKLMRMMLNFSNEQTVSLEDELNLINSYIVLEQLRLINSFEWKVLIGKNIKPENIGIPPMIIQPFVENAIIHGLLSLKNRKGVLDLNFAIEGDLLQVKITDNGIGRQLVSDTVTSHKPSGILISRKRLELINKLPSNDNSYLVTDLKDKFGNAMGTEVVLKIKIEVLDN